MNEPIETAAPPMLPHLALPKPPEVLPRSLRSHANSVAMAGLLAFAGPLTFFTGALGVMPSPTASGVAQLGLWWGLYGISLWFALLAAGYACERATLGSRHARATLWLLAACVAAAAPNLLTSGRSAALIEHGLVESVWAMNLHGFTVSLVMATLYFVHVRRSREHERAAARLAAAQSAQRGARRRIVEARLQEVQARIDPQVLFDLLEKARRLYEDDPVLAERFLDELVVFLRAALPRLRAASSSLLREVEIAHAFVALHARAGAGQLSMTFDLSADVMHARFPPGVMLPLLDGAVASGRPCRLRASREGSTCRLALTLGAPPSRGAAARVVALLAMLYGPAARMSIASAAESTQVWVEMPYELA